MFCWFVFRFILAKGGLRCKEGVVLLKGSDGEFGTLDALTALSKLYLHIYINISVSIYTHGHSVLLTHVLGRLGAPVFRTPSHSIMRSRRDPPAP